MVFSGSQWFLGSYKHKMCDRNNANAGQSTYSDLCTAVCRQWYQWPYWLDYNVGFMFPILTRKNILCCPTLLGSALDKPEFM